MDVQYNVKRVLDRVAEAAHRANRAPEDITVVAVTKTVEVGRIMEAIDAGIRHIGENRVQEFVKKHEFIPAEVKRHLIGTLQTNKVKYIIDKVDLIHSLDRISLAKELDRRAATVNRVIPVLIQVNVSKESTKSGIFEEELESFIERLEPFEHIRVKGLMTIAPLSSNPESARPYFARLKELFEKIKERRYPYIDMEYLSMGMTNDFEVAIEEGANIVRIGRAIFGERYV
ncbi:YggS family pyridoxal phosphate-dependent enzyme [Caldicoprobacter algeriensis]|uniref:YggS family pyridoxal phosphate-dependent enzyme n=1 Tax=Caldicoprobacter algeriensis TaxID=699281 RepID=UPI00207A4FA9|nr:YggS family pyridoxal phosphate-dependent enzyme [Caldicoprobacter algeriensis]MCM8899684.1 YggS family pyridoxal phosphate-dependent enzyme [Caldicoprobacter algeriensis]